MVFNVTGFNIYVTVISDPNSIPITGLNNTFDYPILRSISLLCMATTADGSSFTVDSYNWNAADCYNRTGGVQDPCFYSGSQAYNVTGMNLLAQDAGTATCSVIVDGAKFTSDPFTLRISGE